MSQFIITHRNEDIQVINQGNLYRLQFTDGSSRTLKNFFYDDGKFTGWAFEERKHNEHDEDLAKEVAVLIETWEESNL